MAPEMAPTPPAPTMDMLKLVEELRRDEGRGPVIHDRYYPYRDSLGITTIGTGHNLSANGLSITARFAIAQEDHGFTYPGDMTRNELITYLRNKGISERVRDLIEHEDIATAIAGIDKALPWVRQLSDARQRAVVNMAFNLGLGGLEKFSHFLAYLQGGEYDRAYHELVASVWWSQVGDRAHRIADMILAG